MNIGYDKIGALLYCDTGLHDGDMCIDLHIRLYLSPQEYASYQRAREPPDNSGDP